MRIASYRREQGASYGVVEGETVRDAGRLAWLESELASWHDAGLVDDAQAQAIRGRYVAARRFSLARLLLLLGGGFVGVGLLWLVASNLDELSPLLRFLVVTALWLGIVATAVWLHAIDPIHSTILVVSGGVSAVLAYRVIDGPLRFVSVALGSITLMALAFGMFGAETALFEMDDCTTASGKASSERA